MDAAIGHRVQRARHHPKGRFVARAPPAAEQELEDHRRGELRRAAESAVGRVERCGQAGNGGIELSQLDVLRSGRHREPCPQVVRQRAGLLLDLVAPGAVGIGDGGEHAGQPRHAVAILGREVRAAEEGLEARGQEDGHRPSARAGHRLHGGHVDVVEVGPLLAIDLDRDEVLVHLRGDGGVLERLALHDVAPVARGVADREEDRPILGAGALERLGAPWVPVDGVVGVLEQVGARLGREAVRHAPVWHAHRIRWFPGWPRLEPAGLRPPCAYRARSCHR